MTVFDSCSTRSEVQFDFGFSGGWWSTPAESGASTYLGAASSDFMNLIFVAASNYARKPKVWQKNSLTPTILTHWRLIAKSITVGFPVPQGPDLGSRVRISEDVWPDFDDQFLD